MKTSKLLFIFFLSFFLSCSKHKVDEIPPINNVIDSCATTKTYMRDKEGNEKEVWVVQIFGKDFPYSDVRVKINGIESPLVWNNSTLIQAELPPKTGSGPIEIEFFGQTFKSPKDLVYPWHGYMSMYTIQGNNLAGLSANSICFDQYHNLYYDSKYTVNKLTPQNITSYIEVKPQYYDAYYGSDICVDKSGMVYRSDFAESSIEKYNFNTKTVTQFYPNENGIDEEYLSFIPRAITIDDQNNLIIANSGNNNIKKITTAGKIIHVAGPRIFDSDFADGTGEQARFSGVIDIAIDKNGDYLVADADGYRIRRVTPAGVVTTIVGNGKLGDDDGKVENASIGQPYKIAVDKKSGFIYFLEKYYDGVINKKNLRLITPDGYIYKIIFDHGAGPNIIYYDYGKNYFAEITPEDLTIDADGILYVSYLDRGQTFIRKIEIE